jgi:hypothetical protein
MRMTRFIWTLQKNFGIFDGLKPIRNCKKLSRLLMHEKDKVWALQINFGVLDGLNCSEIAKKVWKKVQTIFFYGLKPSRTICR